MNKALLAIIGLVLSHNAHASVNCTTMIDNDQVILNKTKEGFIVGDSQGYRFIIATDEKIFGTTENPLIQISVRNLKKDLEVLAAQGSMAPSKAHEAKDGLQKTDYQYKIVTSIDKKSFSITCERPETNSSGDLGNGYYVK